MDTVTDNKEIVSVMTLIFQTIQQLAKPGKGQVGTFENGFITISFNAAIPTDNHELKGCNIAIALKEKLSQFINGEVKMKASSQMTATLPLNVNCAVVTDIVASGNLGTNEVKTFTIIGTIQKKIQEMLESNLDYGISIIISERVQIAIKEKFLTRRLENVTFKNKGQLENLKKC